MSRRDGVSLTLAAPGRHTAVYDYIVKPRTARMEQLVLEAQQHNSA